MRKLLCFGDSNTYGYDPRSYLGSRYPAQSRWTECLGPMYEVLNAGQNGREIPHRSEEISDVVSLLNWSAPLDAFLVMLGSNDLLCSVSAERAAKRLEDFFHALQVPLVGVRTLLIAPPPMCPGAWVTDPRLPEQSSRFTTLCCTLSERLNIAFADAGAWGVQLTFDGVHFSEAGHQAFACGLRSELDRLFSDSPLW